MQPSFVRRPDSDAKRVFYLTSRPLETPRLRTTTTPAASGSSSRSTTRRAAPCAGENYGTTRPCLPDAEAVDFLPKNFFFPPTPGPMWRSTCWRNPVWSTRSTTRGGRRHASHWKSLPQLHSWSSERSVWLGHLDNRSAPNSFILFLFGRDMTQALLTRLCCDAGFGDFIADYHGNPSWQGHVWSLRVTMLQHRSLLVWEILTRAWLGLLSRTWEGYWCPLWCHKWRICFFCTQNLKKLQQGHWIFS